MEKRKLSLRTKIYNLLIYLTNNEKTSRHEKEFDILGFLGVMIFLIAGIILLLVRQQPEWIPFLGIETIWAIDNIRHNRPGV